MHSCCYVRSYILQAVLLYTFTLVSWLMMWATDARDLKSQKKASKASTFYSSKPSYRALIQVYLHIDSRGAQHNDGQQVANQPKHHHHWHRAALFGLIFLFNINSGFSLTRMFHFEIFKPRASPAWVGFPAKCDLKITWMIKFASEMSPGISAEWLNTI